MQCSGAYWGPTPGIVRSFSARCIAQTAAATATVGASMAKASEAMAAIGRTNDPAAIAATMRQFAQESTKMDMGQEMMDDQLDDVFDSEGAEDETDDVMNQVWDCAELMP